VSDTSNPVQDQSADPLVRQYRHRIDTLDAQILEALESRVALVADLHRHKQQQGYPLTDGEREQAMVRALEARARGPVSAAGVRQLVQCILQLTRREAGRLREG